MELQRLKRIGSLKINKLEDRFEDAQWELDNYGKLDNPVIESMIERFDEKGYSYETLESWVRFMEKQVERAKEEKQEQQRQQQQPTLYDLEPYGDTFVKRPIEF